MGCAQVLINDNFMQISPFGTLVPKGPSCFDRRKTPTHAKKNPKTINPFYTFQLVPEGAGSPVEPGAIGARA